MRGAILVLRRMGRDGGCRVLRAAFLGCGASACMFLAGTCSPPRGSACPEVWPPQIRLGKAAARMEGAADVEVAVGEEHHRLKMTIAWAGDSSLSCAFYAPWGAPLATIETDSSGGYVTVGDTERLLGFGEKVALAPYVEGYPFTFGEFIRIIRGGYVPCGYEGVGADSVSRRRAASILWFGSDSLSSSVEVRARGCRVRSIRYHDVREPRWQLKYSDFREGRPARVELRLGGDKYFTVQYRTIRWGS